MPTLTNCTALMEVGFAVNAVAAAAQLYFRDTQREVARRMFAEFKPSDSTLSGAYAEQAFKRFVLEASPGLRMARIGYRWLITAGLTAMAVSFAGLVQAALDPNYLVSATVVWGYGIVCILLLPFLYWVYQLFLQWFEAGFTAKRTSQAERDFFWKSFVLSLSAEETSKQLREVILLADEFILRTKWRQFRQRLERLWERIGRFFD